MAKINLNVEGAFVGDKPKINLNVEGAFVGDSTQKKNPNQNDMASSGATDSTDSGNETAGILSGAWNFSKEFVKRVPSFFAGIGGGLLELAAPAAQSELAAGYTAMSVADELAGKKKQFTPEEKKFLSATSGEMVEGTYQEVQKLKSKLTPAAPKGTSNIFELAQQGRITNDDMGAMGATVADSFLQQATGAIPVVGQILNFAGNFESRYEEARKGGISPDKAMGEGLILAGVETEIERRYGVDKMIAAGFAKKMSREAIKEIAEKVLSKDAFEETVKKTAKALSWENIKEGFIQGALPEFLEEAGQTYIDMGEKKLFDFYEKKKKEGDPNAKLELYDPKDEQGLFKTKTLTEALNAGFWGGFTGQMGGMFVNSRSFNPSIYSTLQNSYDSQGKNGLASSVEDIKKGLTKANQENKLDADSYNNALKNVDKIAANVASFEQNSKVNSYARYSLFNIDENLVPMMANGISKDIAQIATPMENPTSDQIDDDIKNNNLTTVSFENISDVPDAYKNFAEVKEDEQGKKVIQFEVPNSIVKAYNDNQIAIQTLMNNPLFAIQSLTDNNRVVTIEDLENIGLSGGQVFPTSSQQLQFKTKFEEIRPAIINGLQTINYMKSVSNKIKETGESPDPTAFNNGIANIYKFNTGDTVFYNDIAHKILGTSPDGQKLKLSGIQEQVDASSESIKTQKQVEEANAEPKAQVETTPVKPATTEAPVTQQEVLATPTVEEQVVEPTQKTIGEAIYELTPFVYQGKTGRLRQQSNGTVLFETKDRDYELGNIADLKDKTLAEWDIVQQEMSTDKNFSVTIDGKTFSNKNQNPFAAITYDENGDATSVKLQDEKGKTKVIKGARALLIDAQYKERKILNESTDEQLNEIEQQVTARTEDIGNAEQATTGGQVKPVEPAFTEKQRERKRAIDEVAKRLAQESDNSKNTKEAIANVAASLFKAGIKVELMTSQQIKDKYGVSAEQGFFLSDKGTIVINKNVVESEWGKTIVFHEGTHPIINIIRNTDPKTFKQLVEGIRDMRADNPIIDSLIKKIEANPSYKGQFTQNDEIVVETIAMIASGKLKLNELKPSISQKIKDIINKIGNILGFKQVIRDNNDVAFVRLANQISDVLNSGRDISEIVGEKNIGKFNLSPSGFTTKSGESLTNGDVQFSLFNDLVDTETGFSHQYLKDSNDFIRLVNEGAITNEKVLSDFEGKYLFFHAPDNAFSGNLLKDGKVVVKGQGGIFYPILNYAKKLLWASTSTASDKLVKYFNENAKLNNGSIYFGLVSTDPNKLLSSTTAAVGVMDMFSEKAKDNSFDITEDEIARHLAKAFKGKTILKDKKNGDKTIEFKDIDENKLSGDLNSVKEYIESRLNPDNSSFDDRKYFVHRFLENIANATKDYSLLAKQLGEFFHIKMENESFRGKYSKGYKISKSNLIDNISHILTEPLLKGQETGGKVYAVIEVSLKDGVNKSDVDNNNVVSSIKSDSHKSYPDAIKINDDRFELKVHILQDRKEWYDNTLNNKNTIVGKSKSTSVMPTTAGITMGSLKVAPQMSDIDREYTPESTVADAGMTMKEREAWKEKNKVNQRQTRNPFVQKAASALLEGDITLDDYVSVVREKQPINPFNEVPMLPSVKEIIGALDNGKLSRGGVVGVNRSFNDGDKVATRLDIPAYEDYNTWVVSIHDQFKEGKVLAYGQTAVLNNVKFKTSAKGGIGIAINKDKTTIARMFGDWKNEKPESVHRRAQDLINDPNWVQVGMNPFRHSFFYDKDTGDALLGADEVIQVGALVLARNVERAPIGSEAFNNAFSFQNKIGQTIQFSDLSRDDVRINALRNEYYNNDVNADVLVEAAMSQYGIDREAAETLVSKATGSVLDLTPYSSDNKAKLDDEQIPTEVEQTLEQYTRGYKKDKAEKLNKEKKKTTFADVAVKLYDSKFKIRRILQSLSDVQTLSSAKLRNIMGKAKASSMEAQKAIANIYGGMGEKQIQVFDELVFALGVIQKDKNNNEKVYKEYDRLRKEFVKQNDGKRPNERQLEDLMAKARESVPELHHGLLDERLEYTAKTAQHYIETLRKAYRTEDFDNLMARAAEYKKVGNESVEKMRKAGLISNEVADNFKDDFYSFRKTIGRYYDDYSSNIPIYYKDGVAYYSAFKSLGEGSRESYFQRDSRVLLAENILIVNKAVAKNDLRKSIFNDIMSSPSDFFQNSNSRQAVIVDKNGADLSNAFRPANYTRGTDGAVKQDVTGYIAESADEGFVNVPFRVDGKLQYFQMNKELYDEMEGLNAAFNPSDSNGIVNLYYDVSNVFNMALTASQTRYNPLFFWRNMNMDIRHQVHFTDYWTSDKNWLKSNVYSAYGRLLFKSIANTRKIFSNDPEMVKLLEEATEVGLFMDTYSEAREQITRSSEVDTYSVTGKTPSRWERAKTAVAAMNVKTEIAMRVSAYEQAKKFLAEQYKKMHNVTELNEAQMEEIKEIASAQARGYTDFAQKGTFTPQLNYAYLNASIQGLGSAIEYSVDNPAKTLKKTSELFVGHMIWTTMLMMAIPDLYDELDEYTKDVYMLSPTGFMMSKIKDSLGLPSSFIPSSKIDPTLVPVMGIARRTAEHIVRSLRGEDVEPVTYEETARLVNIALPSIFNLPEKTAPVDAAVDWASKILSGSSLGSFGTKLFFGYDAFRGRYVDSKNLQGHSKLLDGMHDPEIPYIYKVLAKASALATDNPEYQVSPARLSSASESVFGSPKSSFLTGVITAVVSDLANVIIPASEIEKSEITTFNPKTVMKSFGVITDSGMKERLQNKKFLEESQKLNLKAADIETIADKNIELFYKQNPATVMDRVEKYAEQWEYAGDEEATERLLKKAELKVNKLENKAGVPKDLSNEVKIIYYTKGTDNQAKMLKSIAGDNSRMANNILDALTIFGMDESKIIEIEDKYYQK